jgi:hypothetical protein
MTVRKIQKPQRPLRKIAKEMQLSGSLHSSRAWPAFADLYSEGLVQEEAGYGQAGVENFETS